METIAKTTLENKVVELFESILEPKGFRIVDLDCRVSGKSLVRVFIDRTVEPSNVANSGGVKIVSPKRPIVLLDDCAEASRLCSAALETEATQGFFPGPFDLEVSSPGLDRRLRLKSDFEQMGGRKVKLKLLQRIEGKGANVTGEILRVDGANLVVKLDKDDVVIPFQNIKQANVVWEMKTN